MHELPHYDLVIVGGGMVGASLACALRSHGGRPGLRILVLEAAAVHAGEQPAQESFDARSTALSQGSADYFRAMGLWESLLPEVTAIKKIHVSDQGRFGAVRIDSREQDVTALGYVIPNSCLGKVLNQALLQQDSFEFWSGARVSDILPGQGFSTLKVLHQDRNLQIAAALVVLAEGGRSDLGEKLGIARQVRDYRQTAIIGNVAFSQAHQGVAYERFTPHGPLALLPLPALPGDAGARHRAALVWTHSSSAAEGIMALPDAGFLRELQRAFGYRLGQFTRIGERAAYPLRLIQAEEQVRPGLVLLGNTAHTLHPVAGQGFNLALRDTMVLAEFILTALSHNDNPGALKTLQAYQGRCATDQERTIIFSDTMTRLFSTDNQMLAWVRKFGLVSIDLIPALKTALSQQAMGLAGRRAIVGDKRHTL
ncbi:MAG: 2-octaprenyl-6-methoxyphenyl hydroxylase [Pseudomonadales bacterium]|nr:2-octaprenyl-6-methoxyphenyl hydroxylase [Pseudomonadales bacterium]